MKLAQLISAAMVAGWALPSHANSPSALDADVFVSEQPSASNPIDAILKQTQQQVAAMENAVDQHLLRHLPSAPGWPCGAAQSWPVMEMMRAAALAIADKESRSSKSRPRHPEKRTNLSLNGDECPDGRCTWDRAGRTADTIDCADCGGLSDRT